MKNNSIFGVGKSVFIKTPTNYYMGTLVASDDEEFVCLSNAKWVADTGRFGSFLSGNADENLEIEKYSQDVYVAKAAIIEICELKND